MKDHPHIMQMRMSAASAPLHKHTVTGYGRFDCELPAWDGWLWSRHLIELCPRQHLRELVASGNPELRVDPVEVRADRAVGEVELLADLAVREALGGEVRDLEFLRGQMVAGGGVAAPARFP